MTAFKPLPYEEQQRWASILYRLLVEKATRQVLEKREQEAQTD